MFVKGDVIVIVKDDLSEFFEIKSVLESVDKILDSDDELFDVIDELLKRK